MMLISKNRPLVGIRNWYYRNERRLIAAYSCIFLLAIIGTATFYLVVPHINTEALGWKYQEYWMDQFIELKERYETSSNKQALIPFILDYVNRNPATNVQHRTADSKMQSLILLSRAYEDAGYLKKSKKIMIKLTNFQPNDYTYQIRLAHIALKHNDGKIFNSAVNRTLELNPCCTEVLTLLFSSLSEKGKYTKIIEIYNNYMNEPQFDKLIVGISYEKEQKGLNSNQRTIEFVKGVPVDGKSHQFRFSLYGFDQIESVDVHRFQIKLHETAPFAVLQNIIIQSNSVEHRKLYHCQLDTTLISKKTGVCTIKSPFALKPSDSILLNIAIQKPVTSSMIETMAICYRRMGMTKQLEDFLENMLINYHSEEFTALLKQIKKTINYGG